MDDSKSPDRTPTDQENLRPFRIVVGDAELDRLRKRIAGARWPDEPARGGTTYGVPLEWVQELADYWREGYDWRSWEANLNEYPQFMTTVDGANIHFLHVRSTEVSSVPLLLLHGWPGSVAEFLDVIEPLTNPRAFGLDPAVAFDLVIPSLPGFAWSGPPSDVGWGPQRIARAFAILMRRLGYHRYGVGGNDWGAVIAPELGRVAPEAVVGVHVTQLFSLPEGESMSFPPSVDPSQSEQLDQEDRAALEGLRFFQQSMSAYHHVQSQQPQTLAFAISDSPTGLLAWNSQVMRDLDRDALLTHVSIYWLTDTAGSALRIYAEAAREGSATSASTVPLGLAQFPDDMHPRRVDAQRDHSKIVSWNRYESGGHFAARQEPALFIEDVRGFFASVTNEAAR